MTNPRAAASSAPDSSVLLGALLRDVSRTFYRTLRVLPAAVRTQIGLAYLLARATDTIADTDALPAADRLGALQQVRAKILAETNTPIHLPALENAQAAAAERLLLARLDDLFDLLSTLDEADQKHVRQVIEVITSGQELDLRRFAGAGEPNIRALANDEELDDYTWRVAGCVGDFWTRLCLHHLRPAPAIPAEELAAKGVLFGKGLQLVNILRDIPRDLRNGRCYLPLSDLSALGLTPSDLLLSQNEPNVRPLYNRWLARAASHLGTGWEYVLHLPWRWIRLRLACAWPILIGQRTLQKLERENILDPAQRIKVSRREVNRILRRSVLALPFPGSWRRLGEKSPNSERPNKVARG